MNFSEAVLQLFLIVWLTIYTHAANHTNEPFWRGFLNPFGWSDYEG